jgi:hypothetical protein
MKISKAGRYVIRAAITALLVLTGLAGVIFKGNARQAVASLSVSIVLALLAFEGSSSQELYATGIKITPSSHPRTYRVYLTFLVIMAVTFFTIFIRFAIQH